jgi:hypothetical protein
MPAGSTPNHVFTSESALSDSSDWSCRQLPSEAVGNSALACIVATRAWIVQSSARAHVFVFCV